MFNWLSGFIKRHKLGNDLVIVSRYGKFFITRNPNWAWLKEKHFEVQHKRVFRLAIKLKLRTNYVLEKEFRNITITDLLYNYRRINENDAIDIADLISFYTNTTSYAPVYEIFDQQNYYC